MSDLLLNVVIIAEQNTSLRFLHTLESIREQEYSNIRAVVVDVNEQNSMYSLGLQEDLSFYPEVEYIKFNQFYTIAETRNYLLDRLEGEFVAFLNDNDTWDLVMAITQVNKLNEDCEAAASCVNGILIDERRPDLPVEDLIENFERDPSTWVLHNPVKMSAQVIYRSSAIKRAGGFDKQFTTLCDADMVLRLSKKSKVLIANDKLCECRLTSSNSDYELMLFLEYKKLKLKYLDLFILNRRMSQKFYGKMLRLAKQNYRWLDFIIYIIMYFIKDPLRTINVLAKKAIIMFYYSYIWIRREISLVIEKVRIDIKLRLFHKVGLLQQKFHKHTGSIRKKEEETVTFFSRKHFMNQNPMKYVFNKNITNVVIPDNVKVIKKGMFYGCKRLETIEIPSTVIEIEAHAFHNCISLRHIRFQKNSHLNKIGDYAFASCNLLKKINLPSSVSQIGKYAFVECFSLKQLKFDNSNIFPSSIERIPRYAFAACSSLQAVEFGVNSILEIVENGAFYGCENLIKIVFTGRVMSLGAFSLAYCRRIETVAFLQIDSLKNIGKCAFMYDETLPYFQLPNELERIRARTFYGCLKLKFIKIPKNVLSINYQAFGNCSLLSNVMIQSGDIMISATAFDKHTEIEYQETLQVDK